MYCFYLNKIRLPVAPSKVTTEIKDKNKIINLINEGETIIPKTPGLTTISFDCLLPNIQYPFAHYDKGFKRAGYFLEKLKKFKLSKKPLTLKITRELSENQYLFNSNMKVFLSSYTIVEEEGIDVKVSLKFIKYVEPIKYKVKNRSKKKKSKNKIKLKKTREISNNAPTPKTKNKIHVVKKGDCLWKLAKKYYGDGSKYTIIYKANKDKITNPNLIKDGWRLVIPVCK